MYVRPLRANQVPRVKPAFPKGFRKESPRLVWGRAGGHPGDSSWRK